MAETHEIVILETKPASESILKQIVAYFDAQAADYDLFTETSEKRKLYLNSVEQIIGDRLKGLKIRNMLSIACGTGSRENGIKVIAGYDFKLIGVDVSAPMCERANKLGLNVFHSSWLECNLKGFQFDAIIYLHSFGLVPRAEERSLEIKKVAAHLIPGGHFFVDVLNIDDKTEWGPKIKDLYESQSLKKFGYDLGDVFYKKIGSSEISFFHYFTQKEMCDLLETCGLKLQAIHFLGYGQHFGQLVPSDQGAMLVEAVKV